MSDRDREKVIKGLEWILEEDRFGFGQGLTKPESDEEQAGCFIRDAISLLKEQVEIVYCEECNEYDPETGRCANKTVHGNAKTWFCADGERRINDA